VNLAVLLPLIAFLVTSVTLMFFFRLFNQEHPDVERRLEAIKQPIRRLRGQRTTENRATALKDIVQKTAPALARPLTPTNEKEANRLKQRLMTAGFRGEAAPAVFLATKFTLLVTFLLLAGGVSVFVYGFTTKALTRVLVSAAIGFYVPELVVRVITKRRQENIFLGLPDALDLMVVCVEAGLGLDQALRKVSDEMRKSYRVIAEEFGLSNLQMQMGRSRAEVLQDLGNRTGVDDLRSLASILIQADKFGSSIAQALRVQSDAMRTRRRQIAEEKAQKTAVKLIFPMVLFIFPGVFVVLVGPAAITMITKMFPAMSGG
jgi:tight adherence protein C